MPIPTRVQFSRWQTDSASTAAFAQKLDKSNGESNRTTKEQANRSRRTSSTASPSIQVPCKATPRTRVPPSTSPPGDQPKKVVENAPDELLNAEKPPSSNKGKPRKTRRGKRKNRKITEKLTIIGTNANGLSTKKESLVHLLASENPQGFMIQETKMRRKNQLKISGYQLFERVRKGKGGGGIMIGIRNDIGSVPVIVSEHDEVEILVIEVAFKSLVIRFLTAYGPQEEAPEDEINKFYATLEEEIVNCEEHNCGLIAELDCNAKLGSHVMAGDPNSMSSNGKLLWDIVERRECMVVNTSDKCNGTITRSRLKGGKLEESVLDYVV